MINHKSALNIQSLLKVANELKYWRDGSGAEMSITQSGGLPDKLIGPFLPAINEIAFITRMRPKHLMINRLAPGVVVPIHSDTVIGNDNSQPLKPVSERIRIQRYHLPLLTNEYCEWWDEINGSESWIVGYWYGPLPYWGRHRVSNIGQTERIHLICDLI